MQLRTFIKEDAAVIAGWIRSEAELYRWSADRFNKYPLTGDDINANYEPQMEGGRFFPITAVDDDGAVTGHFIIRYPRENDNTTVRFGFVVVDPEKRGRGLGKEMMKLGIEYVKENFSASRIDLGVFEGNDSAKGCYEAAGFREYARRECELPVGEWVCIDMELCVGRTFETERLLLRRWAESDVEDLYRYASDPDVGPVAGWPAHKNIDESRGVIRNVLSRREAYAICMKEDGKAIGAVELKLNGYSDLAEQDDECELGYWLGKPFWGRGIMPEAGREMLRRAFEDLGMQKVWCGYYEGNYKSKRAQEKIGFKFQWRSEDVDVPLMHETRTGYVSLMTREDWLSRKKAT